MRKLKMLVLISLIFSTTTIAKNKIIENPLYEFKTSGIYNITKIELGKNETRLHVYCTFIPGWWVQFSEESLIKDSDSGDEYFLQSIIGTEMGKKTSMPASGDSSFILIYPPLPKQVKKIDFGGKKTDIYGISLDNKQYNADKTSRNIPEYVQNWINEELEKAKVKTPIDLNSDDFFRKDPARIIGYINGYDPRAGFSSAIVYTEDVIIREDYPSVIEIYPDGRFEGTIPLSHPKMLSARLNKITLDFYVEPGQTLATIVDWDEFLEGDQKRNIRYKFQKNRFEGPLAELNMELNKIDLSSYDYRNLEKKIRNTLPSEFKKEQDMIVKQNLDTVAFYLHKNAISPKAAQILTNEATVKYGTYMFDYIRNKSIYQEKDTTGNEILAMSVPDDFWNFLDKVPLNDHTALTGSEISIFINRYEFSVSFREVYQVINERNRPLKSFEEFLLQDKNVDILEEQLNEWFASPKVDGISTDSPLLASIKPTTKQSLEEKMQEWREEYHNLYPTPIDRASAAFEIEQNRIKDSLMFDMTKTDPTFLSDIIKIRSLKNIYGGSPKEYSEECLTAITKDIRSPQLLKKNMQMFEQAFPDKMESYELPVGKGTEIFRNIIDQHKGKILFVDFWATWCGPCISGIKSKKQIRTENKNNPDFKFIFITDHSSPVDRYEKFIEEQELEYTYRITTDEYNHLRQLFRFNGIPRYVIIDKDGKVYDDNFKMHLWDWKIEKVLEDLNR